MQGYVRTHPMAGLLVLDQPAFLVPQPEFGIIVPSLFQILLLQEVLQRHFAEDTLHLVLAAKGLGEIDGLGAYGFRLLPETLHRLLKARFDGGGLLRLRFLLGLEGLFHRFDLLVQPGRQAFHRLGGFLLERLFTGLEGLLILDDQLRLGGLQRFLLGRF